MLLRSCLSLAVTLGFVMMFARPDGVLAHDAPTRVRVVVFPVELQDASHEGVLHGVRTDQVERLHLTTEALQKRIGEVLDWQLVSTASVADRMESLQPLLYCNGCDVDLAKAVGADYGLLASVYKVSNLILEIHLFVRDAASGRVIYKASGSIRGNNDRSWVRGMKWMVDHRLSTVRLP